LALYFMNALQIVPSTLHISTYAEHKFFTKLHKNELLDYILNDAEFRKKAEAKARPWEKFNFIRNNDATIDWKASLDTIFAEYPDNDDFTNSDLIPDYQKLTAKIGKGPLNDAINLELEVDMTGFRKSTERGQKFIFKNGEVLIDIMGSKMCTRFHDGD